MAHAEATQPLLLVQNLHKSFGGLGAVRGVSFRVPPGQIYGLIGPNGAGKTTVFNMIAGFTRPDQGLVTFAGHNTTYWAPDRLARTGLARTFQNIRVFSRLSVLENVMIGETMFSRSRLWSALLRTPTLRRDERRLRERAEEVLDFVGLPADRSRLAGELPYGRRKLLELAMALATEPRLLLLDEPAAGLNQSEKLDLLDLIRRIQDGGVTILLIEHDMNFVMTASSEITVINFGEVIATGPPHRVASDRQVIEAYLGAGFRS